MNKKNRKLNTVAVLVPAHNEEIVIARTLESLLAVTKKEHIYVVSDGSKDKTASVAKKYTPNVYALRKNVGKANALNKAIERFKLNKRYKYVMPMDADSTLDKKFFKSVKNHFSQGKNLIAVAGKVKGKPFNWITSYRCWEYEVAQSIHKKAQSITKTVVVCPGPSTVYRAEIFDNYRIPNDNKAEDMDFTFTIQRNNLGKIGYESKAIVNTQDPKNLKEYLRQIDRWYTGFWNCVLKHNIPWKGQLFDFEVGLLALEGLFNGFFVFAFLGLLPFVATTNILALAIPVGVDFFAFTIPTLILTSIRYRTPRFFLYIPHFYMMRFLTSMIFLKSFWKIILWQDLKQGWNKASRYATT